MSETQALLSRIVALRQRLEQARGQAHGAGAAAAGLLAEHEPAGPARLRALERRAAEGGELAWQLEAAVRPLAPPAQARPHLPAPLTARARPPAAPSSAAATCWRPCAAWPATRP